MGNLLWAAVISILLIVGMSIANSKNLDLKEIEGRKEFVSEYGKWLLHIGKNVKNTAGYVVKQEWRINITANNTE